jgi:uncharacterized protein (DUF58 family)
VIAKPGADSCPPEVLARISDLELVARIIVDGLVSGPHRSPFHGYSAEFSQYRHYRPGDDLKYVDWKLVARTDRVYTKQFRETTNMAASLVVDTSASMAFPESPSKFRYAVCLAAALAHLISRQGDAVGLLAAEPREAFLLPKTGRSHLGRLLATLSTLQASSTWSPADAIRRAAERLARRGLLIVFSDFYDGEEAAFVELRRAARMGHDVALFQIVSRAELEFPYARDLEFADLETGQTMVVNADAARREYRGAIAAFVEDCRRRAGTNGIQYTLAITDMPHERTLRNFLLNRRTLG